MTIGIYKITNKTNGKVYIGQSYNVERRMSTHRWAAFKEDLPSYNFQIYKAIRKYGVENFDYEVLESIPEYNVKTLNELEIKYIEQYDSFKNGYNMTSGGDNSEQNRASGERNSHAKLTKKDVIDIRERYNNHELKRDVYSLYEGRIGESGFHKIWNWQTWKTVLPEYHNEENIKWHSSAGRALSSEQAAMNASKISKEDVYLIRELYNQGVSNNDIIDLLNLSILSEEVRRIGKKERFGNI